MFELGIKSHRPLREIVYEELKMQILRGTIVPGTRQMEVEMAEQMGDSWEMMTQASSIAFSIGRGYYLLEMLLYVASFIGVLMMWRLQKKGFHVYAIAQFLMLIATSVFVTGKVGGGFPFGPIFWTALFVFMYYSHYKKSMQ